MKNMLCIALGAIMLAAAPTSGGKGKLKQKAFEPVVATDLQEYVGHYVGMEPTWFIDVEIGAAGKLAATVHEGQATAHLDDTRLSGARFTGTKVYGDGKRDPFAAEFVDRVLNGKRTFGMLIEGDVPVSKDLVLQHLFYGKR